MPRCGGYVAFCEIPIQVDSYSNCTFGCVYCRATRQRKKGIKVVETPRMLEKFIADPKNRKGRLNWCDWNIPLQVGVNSEVFQPEVEKEYRNTYNLLKVLAHYKYPFTLISKGTMSADPEYLELLKECNVVYLMSLCCPGYDKLEPKAPDFADRLKILETLCKNMTVQIRISPYIIDYHKEIKKQLPKYADAGVRGIVVEGIELNRKTPGFERGDGVANWEYPRERFESHYQDLRAEVHSLGLRANQTNPVLAGLNDDGTQCCFGGQGWDGNSANVASFVNGRLDYTQRMYEPGTGKWYEGVLKKSIGKIYREKSYVEVMEMILRKRGQRGLQKENE